MHHFMIVAGLVLAIWLAASLPLGILIGRSLRRGNARAAPEVPVGEAPAGGGAHPADEPGEPPAETSEPIRRIG